MIMSKSREVHRLVDRPEIMRFWDPDKNGDPSTILTNSASKVNLRCSNCGHQWSPVPVNFFRDSMKCPACELHRAVQPGFTDLFTLVPDLKVYYDPSKNEGVDVTQLGVGSRVKLVWVCPTCGREWQATVNTRIVKEHGSYRAKGCKYCFRKTQSRFTPVSALPQLVQFWDFNNNTEDINLTPSYSEIEVNWRCKKCGYQWRSSPRDRMRSNGLCCPCCDSQKKIKPGFNDALTKIPAFANIYDASLNPGKDLSATALYSDEHFIWKCSICGYSWDASVRNTANSSCNCPNCMGRKAIPGVNTLAALRPDIANNWGSGNAKTPDEVLCKSYFWANWCCPNCKGEYKAYVADMVNGKARCPYCSNERVLPGYNSFAAKHPDLIAEWNYVSNYPICDPDEINDNCTTPVWWVCPQNEKHSYSMSPKDRIQCIVRNKESCPYCKGRRRKKRHFI